MEGGPSPIGSIPTRPTALGRRAHGEGRPGDPSRPHPQPGRAPPRPQAGQHPPDRRRRAQGDRLRAVGRGPRRSNRSGREVPASAIAGDPYGATSRRRSRGPASSGRSLTCRPRWPAAAGRRSRRLPTSTASARSSTPCSPAGRRSGAGTPEETLALVIEGELTSPRELNRKVDRELDAVCLKCLDRDPEPALRFGRRAGERPSSVARSPADPGRRASRRLPGRSAFLGASAPARDSPSPRVAAVCAVAGRPRRLGGRTAGGESAGMPSGWPVRSIGSCD